MNKANDLNQIGIEMQMGFFFSPKPKNKIDISSSYLFLLSSKEVFKIFIEQKLLLSVWLTIFQNDCYGYFFGRFQKMNPLYSNLFGVERYENLELDIENWQMQLAIASG